MSEELPPPPPPPLDGNPDALLLDQIGNIALNPVTVRGIFLMLTRIHWSNPDHYGALKPKMQGIVWNKDAKLRTLGVDYDFNFDPQKLDQRPAIYVGTSDFDFLKVVVDNRRGQAEDNSSEDYTKIASTNVIIRHIGKTPDESWQMADLTAQFFMGMRKLIQERLKVHAFEVVKMVASRPFERATQQADQQFIVDLILNLQYNAAWLIVREGHRLKTVTYKQSLDDYSATN